MGVARHQHVLILVALLNQLVEENLHGVHNLLQLMTGEEFEVYENLVVA